MQTIDYFDTMSRCQKAYGKMLEGVCRKWDLTRNELDVMLFLLNNPGLDRAADIVSRRGIAKSHVSQSVGILEEKGFLRRCEDSADRRTVRLKLTEAAMPIAREGQEAQKRFFARIHRNVSGEELAFLRDLMQRVRDNIVAIED